MENTTLDRLKTGLRETETELKAVRERLIWSLREFSDQPIHNGSRYNELVGRVQALKLAIRLLKDER